VYCDQRHSRLCPAIDISFSIIGTIQKVSSPRVTRLGTTLLDDSDSGEVNQLRSAPLHALVSLASHSGDHSLQQLVAFVLVPTRLVNFGVRLFCFLHEEQVLSWRWLRRILEMTWSARYVSLSLVNSPMGRVCV
jgi:hypothetical protein